MSDNSWLKTAKGFPADGLILNVRYRSGNQSSHHHLAKIGPVLSHVLGCPDPFRGSLNFYAAAPLSLPEPAAFMCAGEKWLFVPVVLAEKAVGLVARRPPPDTTDIIEVFACRQLAPILGLKPDDETQIRLLSGKYIALAA